MVHHTAGGGSQRGGDGDGGENMVVGEKERGDVQEQWCRLVTGGTWDLTFIGKGL